MLPHDVCCTYTLGRPFKGKHSQVVANFQEGWVTYTVDMDSSLFHTTSSAAQLPNVGGDISRIGRKRHNSESWNTVPHTWSLE